MKCPRCQHEKPSQANLCLECGARQVFPCLRGRAELPRSELERLRLLCAQFVPTLGAFPIIPATRQLRAVTNIKT